LNNSNNELTNSDNEKVVNYDINDINNKDKIKDENDPFGELM
jgi:hypothetical protein